MIFRRLFCIFVFLFGICTMPLGVISWILTGVNFSWNSIDWATEEMLD